MARSARPAPANAKAKSPVGGKRNREGSGTGELQKRLTEALAQHAAIGEILRVMSDSPSDVQPVLDAVAERAAHLCEAPLARVILVDGDEFRARADYSLDGTRHVGTVPVPLKRTSIIGRAVLDRATIHHDDVVPLLETEYPDALNAQRLGLRAVLAVPLMREGKACGVILLWRREPGRFSREHVALVQTFAAQAAIAVENVRLFNETKEGLEQQRSISEILRMISTSPGDVKPVLDAVADRALNLCDAANATVFLREGDKLRVAARFSNSPTGFGEGEFMPLTRGSVSGRTVLDSALIEMEDVGNASEAEFPLARQLQLRHGHHAILSVPLMREDVAIGAITLWRMEVRRFTAKQIALVKTFANQAAIALENVRLFTELTHKNRALTQAHAQVTDALERQTATSEVLRVISSSPTDVQPVFETIVASAARLCGAESAAVYRFDGEIVHFAAGYNFSAEASEAARRRFPRPLRETDHLRRVQDGSVLNMSDIEKDPRTTSGSGDAHRARGVHSTVLVPMVREDHVIGAIGVSRREVGSFGDERVELLKTFADQAVIAIENVRLFTELEARTTQLTKSVGELKALGEVGQAVSSTLDLETVLSTIVSRAVQLAGMDGGSIWEYDEGREEFCVRATDRLPDELVEENRATPIRKGEGALGRLAMTGEPAEIPHISTEPGYPTRLREILVRSGYHSVLAVPLLREDHLLGALAVIRSASGTFAPEVVALLKTFATQSALAIQNARLYREIEVKSLELEAASRHKSEFLANMSHELRTPLNAILGFSEILSERMFGEINEKQAEYLGDILESGQHLLSLINDILDLSKIEAGRMELELSDFDLPNAIENTLILVRERAQRLGVTLACAIDERLGIVRADERKLKQVLLNLLSNALKFTPEGGRISVSATLQDEMAEISVRDTGVGIAPEDQEAVFEEFRQVGTASKKVEGTGLGLAISRKFIELHGGRIWITSQVGIGSTFAFALPLQQSIV
jgi:signal transduction histidine kinase/putative methionine-R-sulfoxide reductase with GAF domain